MLVAVRKYRKALTLFLALVVWSPTLFGEAGMVRYNLTVSNLPAVCVPTRPYWVTDGATPVDCSTGSGSYQVLCMCNPTGDSFTPIDVYDNSETFVAELFPACVAAINHTLAVDTDGDACWCDGSTWNLAFAAAITGGGGTCSVVDADGNWQDNAGVDWEDSAGNPWGYTTP